jgi:hypothetical protein
MPSRRGNILNGLYGEKAKKSTQRFSKKTALWECADTGYFREAVK